MKGVLSGLDRLLDELRTDPGKLRGRRYGLLGHGASLTTAQVPAHLALAASPAGPPTLLLGPEHGYYGVEQDMIPADHQPDPWTGVPIVSLYGDSAATLRPDPKVFSGLDLVLIDLQDVGSRYYTYAATAVWTAQAALAAGCEVWVLDRPNPLGGEVVEGNLPEAGFESFVGAFRLPVRHGLTVGEIVLREGVAGGWASDALSIYPLAGWRRAMCGEETGWPFVAPSPNMPSATTAFLYPGLCLIEATTLSEGRGTTRPFQLVGAPGIDPLRLANRLNEVWAPDTGRDRGIRAIPTYFRPQFQKHAGQACGGVELVVTSRESLRAFRAGLELLSVLFEVAGDCFRWRPDPYEFVADQPAIDLLTGTDRCRRALEAGGTGLRDWMATFVADEAVYRKERRTLLLYPEETP